MPIDLTQELPVLFDDLAAEVIGFVRPVGLIRNGVTVGVGRGYDNAFAPTGLPGINQQLPDYRQYDYICEFNLEGPQFRDVLTVDGVMVGTVNTIGQIGGYTNYFGIGVSEMT